MMFEPFKVGAHNSHYEGAYDARELTWLQVCAVEKARNVGTLLGGRPVASVLEVGCGSGVVLAEVAKLGIGSHHVGIDMVDPRAHPAPGTDALELLAYDGEHLPYEDDSFDLVIASHVVEHVPDPRGFLREVARVCKGWVYLEVPCELNVRASRAALQKTLEIGHINAYTPEAFGLTVQTSGLAIIDSELLDHTREVLSFGGSALKGRVKKLLRGGLLGLSPRWASRVFTYHFGVLCVPEES